MSGEKTTSPCNKFQANIFNKSKCQNCFKSRQLHLMNDHDMEQAKPIYGGWLCLAPEGTDFDNPMQRSRKWQRRFFILYEHGSLSFALDELPSTLPQGTVNMNLCTDITDAEPRTGQRNALCVFTPEQEIFIRGDNKEIINGWSEQLAACLRTNKQNQEKKRKVELISTQGPSPAKMAATDPSFPSSTNAAESGCGWCQEDQQDRGPAVSPTWTVTDTDPPGPGQTPAGNTSTYLSPVSRDSLTLDGSFVCPVDSLDLVAVGNGNDQLAESNRIPANNKNQNQDKSPTDGMLGSEAAKKEQEVGTAVCRKGRTETRADNREKLQSCGDMIAQLTAPPPRRRSRSLDRRTSDNVMTPDLLNFKKGWMVRLDENDQWKKYWFVLSTDSLRYYKDSMAEEASDLEGEIDLTKCFNVSEYQVQRNYGFQIHTPKDIFTFSAMTSGIRKNWIQALMKNVHPANAPDVTSLPGHHGPSEPLPKPDVTQDSPSIDVPTDLQPKRRTVMEKRREGRYKTFDWAEFRPRNRPTVDADPRRTKALGSLELGDRERRRRREERRRKYESMLGISLGREVVGDKASDGSMRARSPKSQQKVEEEIEEWWRMVETTVFRLERSVSLFTESKDSPTEKLLDSDGKKMEDLTAQLAESECRRLELEAQLGTAGFYQLQLDPSLCPETDICPNERPSNSHTQTLKDSYKETRELLRQQNVIRQNLQDQLSFETPAGTHHTPSIWLHDTDGDLQDLLEELLPETVATPLLSPASDNQDLFSQSDGETNHRSELDRKNRPQVLSSGTQVEYSPLVLEKPAEGDDESPSCCVEYQISPEQVTVRKLSQEVELLTSQNKALNQRNQEMLNQLTEADREIDRLKAELSCRYSEPCHLPEVEQLRPTGEEDLERELNLRNQQLLEAQTLISSLEENLRESEMLLQLNVPAGIEETGQEKREKEEGYLLRCLEATEAKLTELEMQLSQSEETCRECQAQNAELKEAEKVHRLTAAEAETDVRRLSQELDIGKVKESNRSGEERIQGVIEGMITKFKALGKLLEVMDRLDVGLSEENKSTSQLRWEEEFWRSLLNKLSPSHIYEDKAVEELLREVTECMIVEKKMLLLGHSLLSEEDERREGLTETKRTDGMFDFNNQPCEMKRLRVVTQMKTSLLTHLASSVSTSTLDELQLMADSLSDFSEHRWSGFIQSAATEAFYCYQLSRLHEKYERELEESKQKLLASSQSSADQQKTPETAEEEEEEMVESPELDCMEIHSCDEGQLGTQRIETDVSFEAEQVLLLRGRVKELEEQLSVVEEEFDRKLNCFQTQHEKEMERIKVTCERGLTSMEESHVRVVEELQHRHQREVERLLVERDRLLEEESGATATAIEAIKKAHRVELEREVQRRCQSEKSTGDTHLEDIYRQHREELTSHQREFQVLSQQFSLKCLENGHLVQALDAERKALCQCQQENQDLRTRNQELSGHLAAEITRLCSLAKQDELLLSQGMDVYEMEITLRVKESEVQCLKQEITSLREEVQSAQKDKRNATKKYKDMFTELSIVRAKTEREMDELRENLRLAHRALDHMSP